MRACFLAATVSLLSTSGQAGILFDDIKPRTYKKERKMDIHVGQLHSSRNTQTYDFYSLNYCASANNDHKYEAKAVPQEGEEAEDMEDNIEAKIGISMFDFKSLHETFFHYRMGLVKLGALPCARNLSEEDKQDFIDRINDMYTYRLSIDGLPAAVI